MKGGFYNPPNLRTRRYDYSSENASMKGGFYNPPNSASVGARAGGWDRFNEGGVL